MRYAALLCALLLGACDALGLTGQKKTLDFVNRVAMDPPPGLYARWYAEAERCVRQTGNFEAVRWHRADEIWLDGQQVGGVMEFPDDITIATSNVHQSSTVKHEAIHHILQRGDDLHGTPLMAECSARVVRR